MYIAGICFEGSMSQNFDIGLSFCFTMYRRREFRKKNDKKWQSYPIFVIKSKPEPKQKSGTFTNAAAHRWCLSLSTIGVYTTFDK